MFCGHLKKIRIHADMQQIHRMNTDKSHFSYIIAVLYVVDLGTSFQADL